MNDISKLLIDASTAIKVMKEKTANMSNENLFDLENHSRALRQISNEMLDWVKQKRSK
jgi:hypothetical protein